MPISEPGVRLGTKIGPFEGCLSPDLVRRYAAATNDPSALAQQGLVVPPVAIVTQIWQAQNEARSAIVSPTLQQSATGGVHGQHDIVLHRPIMPGERLRIWVEGHGARPVGRNALVTLRYTAVDSDDRVVSEQWWSTVYLGTTCDAVGQVPPDHAFPEAARDQLVGISVTTVDDDMPRRYAEVSGDWSAHHFDVAAAQRSGFANPFLHGLCTMALCAQGVVDLVADGDPARVRRVAVRFATPTFLDEELHLRIYDAGDQNYAFEGDCAGATVITHGRVELS